MNGEPEQIFSFAEFELDAACRRLVRAGETVSLHAKAFDLLLFLVRNAGRVVSRDEILEAVWDGQFVEESNLTVQISALRKILRDPKDSSRFLVTVPGKGYSFVAELDEPPADSEIVIERQSLGRIVVEEEEKRRALSLTKILRFSLSPLLLFLLLAGGYMWYERGRESKGALPFQKIDIKRLTTNGRVSNAAISPDGKLFVYAQGFQGTLKSLRLGHTAGGNEIELRPPADVNYRALRFSPGGESLYYVVTGSEFPTGALFRLPVFGGVPEKLRENVRGKIAFSPDMRQFAYIENNDERDASTLFIAETEGASKRELFTRPIKDRFCPTSPAWSPDGQAIAVGAATGANEAVAYEVFTIDIREASIRQLTKRRFGPILSLEWQSDNTGLVLVGNEHSRLDEQLWHVAYPDGETRQINPDLNDYGYGLGISADNRVVAEQAGTLANIWIAPVARMNEPRQITFDSINSRPGVYGLEWTPDGKIVYAAFTDKSQSLWMMNADGSGKKQLTPAGGIDLNPSVTADGQTIVFGSNRSGTFEVWSVRADGGDLRQLTSGSFNEMPSVSPDGVWVVYVSTRGGLTTLWRVPLAGGEAVRLTDKPASWASVSPDSRFVACSYLAGGETKLAVLSIDGGEPVKIFDLPKTANLRYGLRWTPDNVFLTYRDWENGYWRQKLEGGAAQRIEGLPAEKLYSHDWSPDGKHLAYSRGIQIHDVVLIENSK